MQRLLPDNVPSLVVASTTTVTLAITNNGQPTLITVGGQQYSPSALITLNAATTGANGLDTGALAAVSTYYVYAIVNQSTNALALVASTNSSSPSMPSGYGTAYLYLGYFYTNPSSQIINAKNGALIPAFHVNKNGSTQGSISGATQVTWSESHANIFDAGNCFSSNVFTVPAGQGGTYQFNCTAIVDRTAGSGQANIFIRVNNSATRRVATSLPPGFTSPNVIIIACSGTFQLNPGDTVDVLIDGAATLSVRGDVDGTHFSGSKIA